MDPAVALVEAYLQMNGYVTVVEYPLIETRRGESRRSPTSTSSPSDFRTREARRRGTAGGPTAQ